MNLSVRSDFYFCKWRQRHFGQNVISLVSKWWWAQCVMLERSGDLLSGCSRRLSRKGNRKIPKLKFKCNQIAKKSALRTVRSDLSMHCVYAQCMPYGLQYTQSTNGINSKFETCADRVFADDIGHAKRHLCWSITGSRIERIAKRNAGSPDQEVSFRIASERLDAAG